jgi:RND family efflux transporter MFP subunit
VGLGNWQRLADTWQVSEMAAVRLSDRSGEAVAVCLVAGAAPPDEQAEQFLLLTSQIAGPLLKVVERGAHGHWLQTIWERTRLWLTGWRACVLAAVVLLPAVYPWSARTTCPVVLETVAQRLIAAPFEGVFDRSLVLPGQRVEKGQVLGRMDGRELRTRIAACEADITKASKSRDVNMAAGKLGPAQIDRLEMERLEHELSVFMLRLEQVEIRSPIDGIVVTGDLRKYESATVKVGQTLYEIAPLDQLVAEIAVPEEDLEQVSEGAELSLWLDAAPGSKWDGKVERVHPRGELRDSQQVFVAETTLTNDQGELRPGMKGQTTILGPRSPGIWLLIRKPWNEVRRFLGW